MILMIDNYDSFTYNLVQYLRQLGASVRVVRNDAAGMEEIESWKPSGIVISPGPGRPESAGVSVDVISNFSGRIPLLGVCLGHQAISVAFGGKVGSAHRLMHGKVSAVTSDGKTIYQGIRSPFKAMRYHSSGSQSGGPSELPGDQRRSRRRGNHGDPPPEHPTEGIQFHPESIMTPVGKRLLRNFLKTTVS